MLAGHERPLLRGRLRLYQDRAGAGGAVRPRLPRRRGDAGDGGRDPDRHRRRGGRCRSSPARSPAASRRRCSGSSPARCSRLSAVGFRGAILSAAGAELLMAATLHAGDRARAAGGPAVRSISGVRDPAVLRRDRARLAAVAVRRLHGRARLAVLVPRLRARDRGERAHARAGRGAVRAGDLALRVQAGRPRRARRSASS